MTDLQSFLFGAIQGLTEYLPISSSAHLLLFPHFIGIEDPGLAFDVFLHLGTLLATLIYFWKDWVRLFYAGLGLVTGKNSLKGDLSSQNGLGLLPIALATLPAVIAGVLLNSWIKESFRDPKGVAITLAIFGVLMGVADTFAKKRSVSLEKGAPVLKIFGIGLFQALALIPGVSRSGITLTGGRFLGFSRTEAARISFLLSFPVTLGAFLHELKHFDEITQSITGMMPLVIGTASSFGFGILAIHFLIKWVSKTSLWIFSLYRVLLAIWIFWAL